MPTKINRNKQWLSLVTPPFVESNDEEENEESDNANEEQTEQELRTDSGQMKDSSMAKSLGVNSLSIPKMSPMEQPKEANPNVSSNLQRQAQYPINQKPGLNPLLSGNTNTEAFAKTALENQAVNDEQDQQMSVALGNLRNPKLTADERLQAALAVTNPTPRSIWKRLAIGALQGASQVTPQDTGGSAIGKVLGGVGAYAVPQVDQAQQVAQNKTKAIERYKIDSAIEDRQLKRQKDIADIELDRAKFEQAQRDKTNAQLSKLDTAKRATATRELGILEKLPNEAKEDREAKAKEIKEKFGINVPATYGQTKERNTREYKRYDEELDAYIKVDDAGKPVLDENGDKIITQQGRAENKKGSITKEQAETMVAPINPGALRNQAFNEARKQFSKDKSKKTDIANLTDQEILADPEYASWIRARQQDLLGEAKNNREQEIAKVIASGQNIPPENTKTGTGSNLRVPSKSEDKANTPGSQTKPVTKNTKFDARQPFNKENYRR